MRSQSKRRINVGRINERYFLFSAGMGLDAEVVKQVEADPDGKREHGEWSFLSKAFKTGLTRYRTTTPFITLEVDGAEPARVVLAICCNARPFTYFKRFPVDVCPQARLDRGLDIFALTKIRSSTVARIPWAVFVSRRHIKWRTSRHHHDVPGARFLPDDPLPVQVDGDYLGDWPSAHLSLVPNALDILV